MNESYDLVTGDIGMLMSMPHNGQLIPEEIVQTMIEKAQQVADTD
jgi:N-formylglutamate deformylase